MAILKSTLVNGDLTVTGSLNVQGDLTYVGVKDLRVKDKQIELNATDSGSAIVSGEAANGAGIVFKGTTKNNSAEASILYNYTNDSLVINKTIEGTVSNATTAASADNAASADKVANTLTVNVKKKAVSGEETESVVFDGSVAKTVNIDLKALQDQIEGMSGATGSVAIQISNAIKELDVADEAVAGQYVSSVSETDGKITVSRAALPDYTEVYDKKGAAAAVETKLIGTDDDTATSATIKGAKKYADSLAGNYAKAVHEHKIADVTGLQGELDGKAAKSHTHATSEITGLDTALAGKQDNLSEAQLAAVNSGITAEKVSTLESASHTHDNKAELDNIASGDVAKWNAAEQNAKNYTDNEIKNLGLGTAAQKNFLTGTIADSTSEDLVTAAQVKAYAAGVVGAMHFRGAFAENTVISTVILDPASGDVCLVGTKEYVFNGSEWVLFGDEGAYDVNGAADQALKDAKSYADNLAAGKANKVHTHEISDVNGLQGKLDGKAAAEHNHDEVYSKLGHTHAITNVTGLQDALDGKAASSHTHAIADVTGLQGKLDGKQDNLSADQLNAVNSGITADKVSGYDSHIGDTGIHVTDADKTKWNAAEQNAKDYADGKVADLRNTVDSLSNDVLKSVAAGTYVSVSTKSGNSQTISVTTKDVATASNTAGDNGLALAADVKEYVDGKNATQDTKIANIENGTTLDSRYVNADGDTMTGKLIMNAADIEMSKNGTNGIVFGDMKIVWNSTDKAIEFVPTTA